MKPKQSEPDYIRYLESRCDQLAMQLADLQAAAVTVCINYNLRKLETAHIGALYSTMRRPGLSTDALKKVREHFASATAPQP